MFTNSHSAVPNDPVIITQAAGMHGFVESGHRGDFRDWDEVAASAPADFSFHAASLMGSFDAWLAAEAFESVVGTH